VHNLRLRQRPGLLRVARMLNATLLVCALLAALAGAVGWVRLHDVYDGHIDGVALATPLTGLIAGLLVALVAGLSELGLRRTGHPTAMVASCVAWATAWPLIWMAWGALGLLVESATVSATLTMVAAVTLSAVAASQELQRSSHDQEVTSPV
jgi:hypothetical protein